MASQAAQRVQEALDAKGIECRVVELPSSTRTAVEAAASIGCTVAQIAKSLVFRGRETGAPLFVVASGVNRVDEKRLAELAGEPIAKADAEFVRQHTGFAIGGVPPLGHATAMRTWIDRDLLALGDLWAAAGTPNAVFALRAEDLVALTGGEVTRLAAS